MRFLADENFPGSAVTALTEFGHEVIWIRIESAGLSDNEALAWAARESRVLLTFDKDFGELARNATLPESCGVILFRMPMQPASEVGKRLAERIVSRGDWAGHFSVVELGRVRMRRLRIAQA